MQDHQSGSWQDQPLSELTTVLNTNARENLVRHSSTQYA
jgi:hypothetical protein